MTRNQILFKSILLFLSLYSVRVEAQNFGTPGEPMIVRKCLDFMITGSGSDKEWNKTSWTVLQKLDTGGPVDKTKFKIMYSATGIYVLFSGDDQKITSAYTNDFDDLFKADVFEVFFHPDTNTPLYFEYEINALNKELVLLIPHLKDRMFGWIPWHYEKDRLIKKMVIVTGGAQQSNAAITGWSAELFFPYAIFKPLNNVPPSSGTTWNANFYRLDYDTGKQVKWAWSPVASSFHEFEKYRAIRFE